MLALTSGLAGVSDTRGTGEVDSRTQGCPKVSLEAARGWAGGEELWQRSRAPRPFSHHLCQLHALGPGPSPSPRSSVWRIIWR